MPATSKANLLPKRQAIFDVIRDHQPVSLDFIQRRFITTPPRTLRYHLQQLQKFGLIIKLGSTRGALYSLSPTSPLSNS